MHRQALKKILAHSEPPGDRQQQLRPRKKLGAFLERSRQILNEDQAVPRKQRPTAKRIWERLREDLRMHTSHTARLKPGSSPALNYAFIQFFVRLNGCPVP